MVEFLNVSINFKIRDLMKQNKHLLNQFRFHNTNFQANYLLIF